jgi:hypothetical protein
MVNPGFAGGRIKFDNSGNGLDPTSVNRSKFTRRIKPVDVNSLCHSSWDCKYHVVSHIRRKIYDNPDTG